MPNKGRPRLTPEAYQARLRAYCTRYRVTLPEAGIPPFPSGRRETPQHREWLALYKAHHRLRRQSRNQCGRCPAPASEGSVFCDLHRAANAVRPAIRAEDRRALLSAQDGRCPICRDEVDLRDAVVHDSPTPALLHQRCRRVIRLAETLGPEAFDRLRAFVWPRKARPTR